MQVTPQDLFAVIGEQTVAIAQLNKENAQLRETIEQLEKKLVPAGHEPISADADHTTGPLYPGKPVSVFEGAVSGRSRA